MDPELASQFSMNIDGSFDYMGTSIDNLVKAIQANTEATLDDARRQLESKVAAGQIIDNISTDTKDLGNGKTF
jgi:hypothetical protein